MLAGLYLLGRTSIASEEIAIEWVKRYEWGDHTIIEQEADPVRLVQHITGSLIRYAKSGSDISIGELIGMVAHEHDHSADKLLRNYGLAVRDGFVDVASRSPNLARLLKDTDWHDKWSRTLGDVEGAEKKKIAYFAPGIKTSAVSIPLSLFIEKESAERFLHEETQRDEQELVF